MTASSESDQIRLINRREAIRCVSAVLGGVAFVGGSRLLAAVEKASAASKGAPGEFSEQDIAFLDEIAETILPATKTPGAKAAKTGAFMALMVTDSYSSAEQKIFREGMRRVDEATMKANSLSFMAATPQQRLAVLTTLDHEQKRVMDLREAGAPATSVSGPEAPIKQPAHYFRMMKELALLGYFTSEIGCTKALRYVESPGRFDACIPYTPGEPAWASHA
jgi:Gluconate 2-dehydrogenase subunit 3